MKISKVKRAIAIASFMAMGATAHAGGIPTVDIETILQLQQQYSVLQDQFSTMQQQYSKLQEMKAMATGARGMGSLLNDPAIKSALPQEWKDVLANVKSTQTYTDERAKLPTVTGKQNELYDNIAAQRATTTDFFKKANGRLKQVQDLMNQIDSATDPAAKADLQNRLVSEQNAIQGTNQLLGLLKDKQQHDEKIAREAAYKERVCKEFKKTGC